MPPTGTALLPATPISTLAIGVALAMHAHPAHAQTAEQLASRRLLLSEAQRAARAGDHAVALDLARRAATVQNTPSVREFIARQLVATQQLVAAMGEADACVREAERDAAMQHRAQILGSCRTMLADLEARVGRVTVRLPAALAGSATVHVGERTLDTAMIGVPVPADPGRVTIVVAAGPGRAREERTVTVVGGQSVTIVFDPPAASAPSTVFAPATPVTPSAPATAPGATAPAVEAAPAVHPTFATTTGTVPLRVHASVATADIRIDGALAGIGRVERSVAPGIHRIDASARGHTPFETTVEAYAGTPLDVEAMLPALSTTPRAGNGWVVPVVVVASVLVAAGVATGVVLAVTSSTPRVYTPMDGATQLSTAQEGAH